jgi:hypothetical protein
VDAPLMAAVHIPDHIVSEAFRATLVALMPNLRTDAALWKMVGYLAFQAGISPDEIWVDQDTIAAVQGKGMGEGNSAWKFLTHFQAVLGVRLHLLDFIPQRRCRKVLRIDWPPGVEALIHAERRSTGGTRVFISNGKPFSRKAADAERRARLDYAIQTMAAAHNPVAADLLELLNRSLPRRHNIIRPYLPEAVLATDQIAIADGERARLYISRLEGGQEEALAAAIRQIELTRERQQNILRDLEENTQSFYSPAPRSARVFATNSAVTMLHRSVRKIITQDWHCADLKNCQLAVVASKWGGGIPLVQDFLATGDSVWTELAGHMKTGDDEDSKDVLKRLLYAMMFGGGEKRLSAIANEIRPKAYIRFEQHSMISAILEARGIELERIRKDGYAEDAFGAKILITRAYDEAKHFEQDDSRGLLALVAQSWELRIMEGVIALAVQQADKEHGFGIMSWLHDGLCWAPYKSSDRALWAGRLKEAVQVQADALGIVTRLDIEYAS